MAIGIAREMTSAPLIDFDDARLVKNLTSEIDALDTNKADKERYIKELNLLINGLEAEEASLRSQLNLTAQELEKKNLETQETLRLTLQALQVELKQTQDQISQEKLALQSLESEKDKKTLELQAINDRILQAQNSERATFEILDDKNRAIRILDALITAKDSQKQALDIEIAGLTNIKVQNSSLISEKQTLEAITSNLSLQNIALESGKSSKQQEISNLNADIERLKAVGLQIEQANAERLQNIANREGDNSRKESWLLEKEDILKNTKSELEKFYNRKITNVNL